MAHREAESPSRRRHCPSGQCPNRHSRKHSAQEQGSTRMGPSKQQIGPATGRKIRFAAPLKARLLTGWMAALLVAGFAGAANAQGAVKSVHGDWQIRCDTPPGAKAE